MTYVSWDDAFDVKENRMNSQHRMLFDYVNEYDAAFQEGADLRKMIGIFDKIISYTAKHFEDEEAYMERIDYPALRSHRHIHKQLVARVLAYQERLASGDTMLLKEVRVFLKNWLTGHIKGVDTQYSEYAAHTRAA
ncbi:MAG: hemerythrin family protein [Pseudomonadales bacterium]|nr:hemerythrin family protein [Pseudomonadales bacterium]